jgi:hypothetical protein
MTPDDVPPSDLPTTGHNTTTGEVLDPELPWFHDGRVHSLAELDWAGWELAAVEGIHRDNERLAEATIARIRERTARLNAPLKRRAEAFRTAIEVYAKENRALLLVGQRKSRTLPGSGLTLKWTARERGFYRYDKSRTPAENKAALLKWARSEEQSWSGQIEPLTRQEPVIDLDRIKEYLEATSRPDRRALAPGLEWVPPGETLSIEVDGEEK